VSDLIYVSVLLNFMVHYVQNIKEKPQTKIYFDIICLWLATVLVGKLKTICS